MIVRDRARRETAEEREAFARARRAETTYVAQLRRLARQIGDLVNGSGVVHGIEIHPEAVPRLIQVMDRFKEAIGPWAAAVAERMLAEVARRDSTAWRSYGREMGKLIHREIKNAPTGALMRRLVEEQVGLITSLPVEAAQRVQKLSVEAISSGERAHEIAKEIMRSGHVSRSRADLIARTEVGRAATSLTQARAEHLGSEGYIWRTAGDADVRQLHKKLDGTFHRWDEPPIAGENGERAHAGSIYNCRCWAEPVIPRRLAA